MCAKRAKFFEYGGGTVLIEGMHLHGGAGHPSPPLPILDNLTSKKKGALVFVKHLRNQETDYYIDQVPSNKYQVSSIKYFVSGI